MDFQELNTFVTIAKYGSFSKAAEHLGYSQSAMTVRIKNLEEELGIRLFDRIGKRISLTNQGTVLYDHAVKILNDVQEARESIYQDQEPSGLIKIGTIDSLCSAVFPRLMKLYHEKYPDIRISVTTDTPASLLEMLRSNELDVVYLVDEPVMEPDLVKVMEVEEPAVFAMASGYCAEGMIRSAADIGKYPVILTERDASYRRVLDGLLKDMNIELEPFFQCNSTDQVMAMMLDRQGIAFLPEYTINDGCRDGRICIVPVEGVDVRVYRQILHHKDKWVTREMRALFGLINSLEEAELR